MKYSEELRNAMLALTERYGVTLSEVPERFREKLLDLLGTEYETEIDNAFKPLETGYLRNLRIRAHQGITPDKVNETRLLLATIEGFSEDDVSSSLELWADIFKVRFDAQAAKTVEDGVVYVKDFDETIEDVTPIVDNHHITVPRDFEKVTNQFDSPDLVRENVTNQFDSPDSVKENVVNQFDSPDLVKANVVNQFDSPDNFSSLSFEKKPVVAKAISKNNKKHDKNPKQNFAYSPPGSKSQKGDAYNLESAMKALRDGNESLASRIVMELAREGDIRAQLILGEFYLEGTGIEKSTEKAEYWLRKAAGGGSKSARAKLEEIKKQSESGGCCGCFIVIIIIFVVLSFLGALL